MYSVCICVCCCVVVCVLLCCLRRLQSPLLSSPLPVLGDRSEQEGRRTAVAAATTNNKQQQRRHKDRTHKETREDMQGENEGEVSGAASEGSHSL